METPDLNKIIQMDIIYKLLFDHKDALRYSSEMASDTNKAIIRERMKAAIVLADNYGIDLNEEYVYAREGLKSNDLTRSEHITKLNECLFLELDSIEMEELQLERFGAYWKRSNPLAALIETDSNGKIVHKDRVELVQSIGREVFKTILKAPVLKDTTFDYKAVCRQMKEIMSHNDYKAADILGVQLKKEFGQPSELAIDTDFIEAYASRPDPAKVDMNDIQYRYHRHDTLVDKLQLKAFDYSNQVKFTAAYARFLYEMSQSKDIDKDYPTIDPVDLYSDIGSSHKELIDPIRLGKAYVQNLISTDELIGFIKYYDQVNKKYKEERNYNIRFEHHYMVREVLATCEDPDKLKNLINYFNTREDHNPAYLIEDTDKSLSSRARMTYFYGNKDKFVISSPTVYDNKDVAKVLASASAPMNLTDEGLTCAEYLIQHGDVIHPTGWGNEKKATGLATLLWDSPGQYGSEERREAKLNAYLGVLKEVDLKKVDHKKLYVTVHNYVGMIVAAKKSNKETKDRLDQGLTKLYQADPVLGNMMMEAIIENAFFHRSWKKIFKIAQDEGWNWKTPAHGQSGYVLDVLASALENPQREGATDQLHEVYMLELSKLGKGNTKRPSEKTDIPSM